MKDNWQKVETIFHSAMALPFAERKPFLVRECSSDTELLSEVENLIKNFEKNSDFLNSNVFEIGLGAIGQSHEKDLSGQTIGFYEIKEKIGTGGMGEVYKAFDTQLKRQVALKFLSESLENNSSARRQLVKEARAAAVLEHPSICAVHGIEHTDEHHFIVMQYVEGITLGEKIAGEKTGVEEFKSLTRQILSAVAFAHSHGVIHRDIKPGNIMLTTDGQIKVLDFGLAKVIAPKQFIGTKSNPDTSLFSTKGLIMGTVSYMSPEQLRGEKLDYRSDIFSVGIVLYELLTGQNPFHRPSQAETIAAILNENQPPLKDIAPAFPENLRELVEKCLQKNKNDRFESVAEILVKLNNLNSEKTLKPFHKQKRFQIGIVSAVLALLLVFGIMYFFGFKTSQRTIAILPFSIDKTLNEKEYLADGLTTSLIDALSDLSELKVKNQAIVSQFKGKTEEPQNIGKELGVDAVFVGTIKNHSDGLYLETKIIRTADGNFVDKQDFKIDESQLVELPKEISNRIINKVRLNLSDEDKVKLAKKDTSSEEAQNLYMKGRYYLKRGQDGSDSLKATQYFFDAKEIDQNYAKAWAGLAEAYLLQASPGAKSAITPEQAYQSAKLAANKAIELDNTLAESYSSLGLIASRYEWNWTEAENYFRMAISRKPDFLPARVALIRVLGYLERNEEALQEAKKIKEYDPLSINSEIQIALAYYRKGDYQQTDTILSNLRQKFPDERGIKYVQTYLYLKTNRPGMAIEIIEPLYQSLKEEDRVYAAAPLGFAYGKIGRRKDALKIIEDLRETQKRIYVPAQEEALIYVGIGDYDRAFENLRQSCKEKFASLPNWITDPIVDEIKSDTRFFEIKKCVNL
jgi:non-specific serine/threonine protein kinase